MDLLCTFRRSSLYIRIEQSEYTYSDFVPIRIYIFGSEYVYSDFATRIYIFGSEYVN
jgi:hypothetical protein